MPPSIQTDSSSKLRKWEESLKLKEAKSVDQEKERHRLLEYINNLEARNDELMKTINTLQRKVDILENPLSKSEVKVQCKEPQRSRAHREEVDDLIIGVHERVTRFVLGQVSEQLDALVNHTGKCMANPESNPTKCDTYSYGNRHSFGPDKQFDNTNNAQGNFHNTQTKIHNQDSIRITETQNNTYRQYHQQNQLPAEHLGPQIGERHNAVKGTVVKGRECSNNNNTDTVYTLSTQPVHCSDSRQTTEYESSQHSVPQLGERRNAKREIMVTGNHAGNASHRMQNTVENSVNQSRVTNHYTGQPLIKSDRNTISVNPNQHFLYQAQTQRYRR